MHRRTFLKAAAGAGGILGTDALLRHATPTPDLSVTLYQTARASTRLGTLRRPLDWAMKTAAETIQNVFAPHFGLDIDITFGEKTVPNHITRPRQSSPDRYRALADWAAYDTDTPKAPHSNLLIDSVSGPVVGGIATISVLPHPCCRVLDGHGIIWHDFSDFGSTVDAPQLRRTLLHELGHTVGLSHAHGCNFERHGHPTLSIMLSDEYAARYGWNRYGQSVEPSHRFRPIQFNDRIDPSALRI